jgi:two-component system cell cycle sensor histidine kinase/response regulator CckA
VNSRDAMPNGGHFTVRTRTTDHGIALSVIDTGIGIAPEIIGQIFEPFFTTKPTGQGTGLGLPTVHNIVDQLAGTIEVESAPGEGTAFHFSFPLAEQAPRAAPETEPVVRGSVAASRILLVEDEPAVRTMMARALALAGHEVTTAEDALDALTLLGRTPISFDVLISDVALPGMSGPELVRAVRAREPSIRVLLVSGYTADQDVETLIAEPHTAFLAKPLTPATLRQRVVDLLQDHTPDVATEPA